MRIEQSVSQEDLQAAKEYLRQLRNKDARIEAMLERAQRYREMATRSTSLFRSVPGAGVRRVSPVEEYAIKIVDLEREIGGQVEEYARLTQDIEETIDRMKDVRLRELLRWRYVSGWDWDRIARVMHYERRQVFRLHKRALAGFAACRAQAAAGARELA